MKLRNKKTGIIVELKLIQVNDEYIEDHEVVFLNGEKLTLKLLADSFDDVKEPLIKDEKVRKAIMAWYEALPLEDMPYKMIMFRQGFFCVGIYRIDCGNYNAVKGIKERYYSIEELCGGEE